MFTTKQKEFLNDLKDKEYRHVFTDELIGTSLAFQIRRLRDAQQLTQEELAVLTGKAQETISQWENPNYGRYSLTTLKKLAEAFDVGLLVRFVSFSELADWTIDVSPKRLTPLSYDEEHQLSFIERDISFDWPSSNILHISESIDENQWDRNSASDVVPESKELRTYSSLISSAATEEEVGEYGVA